MSLTGHSYEMVSGNLLYFAGNMVLFDAEGNIKRYESAEAILTEFFTLRLDFYVRRRAALIKVRRCCWMPGRIILYQ